MTNISLLLTILATAANGLVAGASLDQSIKQLPARQRIGVVAYSAYAKAADLGNGILWYASLGLGSVLLTIGAAIAALSQKVDSEVTLPIYMAVAFSILHTLVTTQAAP